MKIHLFNPDNDLALASGRSNYTSPFSARQMASDLSLLPHLWAGQGEDVISLSEDMMAVARRYPDAEFSPWGWNPSLLARLSRAGFRNLPSAEHVEAIRNLSNRATSVYILNSLRSRLNDFEKYFCGESWICKTENEVKCFFARYGNLVLKAPWSCSGKGVRFVSDYDENVSGWVCRILRQQGSIEVEVLCEKVIDFALEFSASADGVRYVGLSMFSTSRGAYSGSIVATDEYKRCMLFKYIPKATFDLLRTELESELFTAIGNKYCGVVGVDLMICRATDGRYLVNPCVEVNLRRTMGWVALQFDRQVCETPCRFFIDYDPDSTALLQRVKSMSDVKILTPLKDSTHYVALLCSL